MRYLAGVAVLVIVIGGSFVTADKEELTQNSDIQIAQYLQSTAVTIKCENYQGSGFLEVTKDGQMWVWGCGHVVSHSRQIREVVSPDGTRKTIIAFKDVQVIRVMIEDGETVGQRVVPAEVIRYSNADRGEDLALLRLHNRSLKSVNSAKIYTGAKLPQLGSRAMHCGSFNGLIGNNSLSGGMYSQYGRSHAGKVLDQVSCPSFSGSSGGIVVAANSGECIGIVVRGYGETHTLIVPIRRMLDYARRTGVLFTLQHNIPIPSEKELRSQDIDDGNILSEIPAPTEAGHNTGSDEPEYPFKIFRRE